MHGISRRGFLELAGIGAATAVLRPQTAPAAGKTVTVLHESSFIPPFDEYIKTTLADAYEKETGVRIVYEVTAVGSLPTRVATITETGAGADITMNGLLQVIQFGDKYLDVTDLSKEIGEKNGGWYEAAREAVLVDGKWKSVPFCNIGQLMNWRTDWFGEVGVKTFPETWEELYEVGKKLKAQDHPFGFELGHGFGDNHGWLYPLLWSYGGAEVGPDGKTVVIDSDETARAIDFARKFFRDTMFEDVLGWTDVSNNKAWMAEQISCTNNAESSLWFASGWSTYLDLEKHESVNLARRALQVTRADPSVLVWSGYVLAYIGEDIDAAIELIDHALALNPSFAHGWYWSGWLRLWAGQPQLAISHLETSLRLSPHFRLIPSWGSG